MNRYLYIIHYLYFCLKVFFCDTISKRFEFYSHQLQIKVKTDTNEGILCGIIDITSPYSYFSQKYLLSLNEKKPKEIRQFQIQENGNEYSVHEFQAFVMINDDIKINSFNYFVFDRNYYNKHKSLSAFAFGFHIDNELHSLTHSLSYNNPYMSSIFSLAFPNNVEEDYGYLFFGETPTKKMGKEAFNYNSTINIKGNKKYWQTELTNIIIPKYFTVYNTNKYFTYFSTLTPYIIVPKIIFEELITQYFGDYLKSNKCKRFGYGVKEYDCPCSVVQKLPSIGFVMEENYYLLSSADLFFPYENICVFNIISNEDEYGVDANHIVLGIRFLWNFVSEFDYEKKSITLFSNKPFGNINEIKGLLKRKLCFVVLLIIQSSLLLSILLNSYVIFNNSKMRMS